MCLSVCLSVPTSKFFFFFKVVPWSTLIWKMDFAGYDQLERHTFLYVALKLNYGISVSEWLSSILSWISDVCLSPCMLIYINSLSPCVWMFSILPLTVPLAFCLQLCGDGAELAAQHEGAWGKGGQGDWSDKSGVQPRRPWNLPGGLWEWLHFPLFYEF